MNKYSGDEEEEARCVCKGVAVAGHAVRLLMEMTENACVVTEGKRPNGRPRRRRGKLKLHLKQIGCQCLYRIHLQTMLNKDYLGHTN